MQEANEAIWPWEWWLVAAMPLGLAAVQGWLFPRLVSGWAWLLWGLSLWEGALSLTGAVALALLKGSDGQLDGAWQLVRHGLVERSVARLLPFLLGAGLALWPLAPWGARAAGVLLAMLVVTAVQDDLAERG